MRRPWAPLRSFPEPRPRRTRRFPMTAPRRPSWPLLVASAMALSVALWAACSEGRAAAPRSGSNGEAATPEAASPEVARVARAVEPVRYDRDVRPLLSDRCFRCHGPDGKKRQKDLRLDVAEVATADRGGFAAIVPGQPEKSEVVRRITCGDPEEVMPPPTSGRRALSADERELVRRWIAEGAHYEPHWSFVPPVRPPVPEVAQAGWCRNAVDRFVLAKLEREGVAPSPEADPATLVRRLFLDLTGLPPTPEEEDAFLADLRAETPGST